MSTSRFVSGSSILLAGWLGATFFNEVPSQNYPKLDRTTAATTIDSTAPAVPAVKILPISASR